MKLKDLIKAGHVVFGYEEPEYVSYEPADNVSLHLHGEEVNNIDLHEGGDIYVITIQGREHVGEFEYKSNDNLPIEVYTRK